MKIAIAQLDPTVADIAGNVQKIVQTLAQVAADAPDLVVFSELFLVGYPPRDLLEREWFIRRVQEGIQELRRVSAGYPETGILFGAPIPTLRHDGKGLYNAALLLYRGEVLAQQAKTLLPSYDVFDETRYFDPAPEVSVVPFRGERLGLHVCEDAWTDPTLYTRRAPYTCDPVALLAERGATLLVNISASPFSVSKEHTRYRLAHYHARKHGLPFVYVNQIGGNDELIFDGRSIALDRKGQLIARLAPFTEQVQIIDSAAPGSAEPYRPQEEIASVHDALLLGLHDYMRKTGFRRAVVGLSGGIDSAVTVCLATEALGKENVLGIAMPSPFSSAGSVADARQVAANLGIEFRIIPITDIYQAYLNTLHEVFAAQASNEAEENIQARIRGNILMAMSNKFGYLVLSTGNKSELAVGYCTLYGDMSGGLAVISDVPKTMIYELAQYLNREREQVPEASIRKPPSAELRPNQTDQDTLPPYPVLDEILHYYVEEAGAVDEIIARGFNAETVRWVARAVDRNEYKRKQAAPGLKVTSKAFGVGRRMPIAARLGN